MENQREKALPLNAIATLLVQRINSGYMDATTVAFSEKETPLRINSDGKKALGLEQIRNSYAALLQNNAQLQEGRKRELIVPGNS